MFAASTSLLEQATVGHLVIGTLMTGNFHRDHDGYAGRGLLVIVSLAHRECPAAT